jgi:hypothetical protein
MSMLTRREWLRTAAAGAAGLVVAGRLNAQVAAPIAITVYKSPSCGCCKKWVQHMEANGFKAAIHDMDDPTEVKRTMAVPAALHSCHTALVGKYIIEGHVPADVVHKLLKDKPGVHGLAVPGMVTGSPGMEGGPAERYDVIAFERNGKTKLYASR